MLYRGYYINLDRDVERRRELEGQLAACNLLQHYRRHPAAQGNALHVKAGKVSVGNAGCFTSHYQLLGSMADADTHVHIIEDDAILSPIVERVIDSMTQAGTFEPWDLIFTDFCIPFDLDLIRELQAIYQRCATVNPDGSLQQLNTFAFVNLKSIRFASTASYIVNKKSIRKVAALLHEAMSTEIPSPIDLYYRRLVSRGQLAAGSIFPFITSVDIRRSLASSISPDSSPGLQTSLLAATIFRNLFFLGCNPADLARLTEQYLRVDQPDRRGQVLQDVVRFVMSPKFTPF